MKKTILLITLAFGMIAGFANNLVISNVTKSSDNTITFDVSWDNSWNSGNSYRDGAYIFIKYNPSGSFNWFPLSITNVSVNSLDIIADTQTYPAISQMLIKGTLGNGNVSGSVTITFDNSNIGPFPDFKVFGIEMVYINEGAYYVGGGDAERRFARGDDNTKPYYVNSSNSITVGNTALDIQDYNNGNATGLTQNIPANYPKGFRAFWLMKYEATQEQYVEFLNTLIPIQQQTNTASDLTNISSNNNFVMENSWSPTYRNGIACNSNATINMGPINFYCDENSNGVGNEADDGQNLPVNRLDVKMVLAYLDWAGLRPMTDMEYEKACRGPEIPIAKSFANGTTSAVFPNQITNFGKNNESVANVGTNGLLNYSTDASLGIPYLYKIIRVGALSTATSTRLQSGASYYGVMDLSGNIDELAILTVDGSLSYNYQVLGDGILDNTGYQNQWSFNNNTILYKGGGSRTILAGPAVSSYLPYVSQRGDLYIYTGEFGIRGVYQP